MPTIKLPWVCKGLVTMWAPKASREVEEKGLAVPGAAAADTAGPRAGQRAYLGPGQAKTGPKGGLSPATLISSRLRVAGGAQLNHCSPDPAEHCIIPQCSCGSAARSHTKDGVTTPAVLWASSWLLRALMAMGTALGLRDGTLSTARGLLRALPCSGPA